MKTIELSLFGGRIDCCKYALKTVIKNFKKTGQSDMARIYEAMLAEIEQKEGTLAKTTSVSTKTVRNKIMNSRHLKNCSESMKKWLTEKLLPIVRKSIKTDMTNEEIDGIIENELIHFFGLTESLTNN